VSVALSADDIVSDVAESIGSSDLSPRALPETHTADMYKCNVKGLLASGLLL